MSFLVRPLTAADRPDWDVLWAGYLAFYETDLDPAVTEITWSRLLHADEAMGALVAEGGGRVVGLCHHVLHRSTWAVGPYCYLEDLFVAPEARGAGAGRALIEATAEAALAAGAEKLYWQTHATNATARALYGRVAHHAGFLVYERELT